MRIKSALVACTASLLAAGVVRGQADSAAVVAVISGFHGALEAGDSTKALSFLSEDVRILETGGIEDKQRFRSGHLVSDINFAKAVRSVRTVNLVVVNGTSAWVVSSSVAQGETNGRQVNSQGAETMILSRGPDGWKIRSIHWSSRPRRPQ